MIVLEGCWENTKPGQSGPVCPPNKRLKQAWQDKVLFIARYKGFIAPFILCSIVLKKPLVNKAGLIALNRNDQTSKICRLAGLLSQLGLLTSIMCSIHHRQLRQDKIFFACL